MGLTSVGRPQSRSRARHGPGYRDPSGLCVRLQDVHWERIVGSERAEPLRAVVLRALQEAYDENCRRHAPDDLGDNNITFGVAVSQNLRFLLERELEALGLPGVEIIRPRGSFAVRIDKTFEIYFYKAPPGILDIRKLRLDATQTQLELTEANTDQLSFDFGLPDDEPAELHRIACIHFGNPFEGLHRADIGTPLSSPVNGATWHWAECLSTGELVLGEPELILTSDNEEEDEDFDLRLRADESEPGMTGESAG